LTRKPCLRCLLGEMPEAAELARTIRELVDLMPPEDRAPAEVVRKRLEACRKCEHLGMGTCGLCGCYVEHRAERARADCPRVPSAW